MSEQPSQHSANGSCHHDNFSLKDGIPDKAFELKCDKTNELELKEVKLERRLSLTSHQDACQPDETSQKSYSSAWNNNQLFGFCITPNRHVSLNVFDSDAIVHNQSQYETLPCLIHPCSNFSVLWRSIILVLLCINVFTIPLEIAFFFSNMEGWLIFNIVVDCFFVFDVPINFFTGIVDKESPGEVVMDGPVVAKKYLKGWFVCDALSCAPLDYIFLGVAPELYTAGRAVKIFKLIKIPSLFKLYAFLKNFRLWQDHFNMATTLVRIMNLMMIIGIIAHYSACIQFGIPFFQGWPSDSWIVQEHLEKDDILTRYTKSIFRAFSHMITCGYGVSTPVNIPDIWVCICSMIAGVAGYALFIGHTVGLIQSLDASGRQFRIHLQQVNEYMTFRKLPPVLRQRITAYYDQRYGGKMFDEKVILSQLSECLRKEVISHNCKKLIQKVPFFINSDSNFINDVIIKLDYEMYQAGDVIMQEGTKGHKMYFIQEGVVEIIDEDGRVKTRLTDGSYFGEISLLTSQNITATVRAASIVNLFSLGRESFEDLLAHYPIVRSTFETIAAQRLHHLGKDPAILSSRPNLLDLAEPKYSSQNALGVSKTESGVELDKVSVDSGHSTRTI